MYRSGTEEEYTELQQPLEDIITYNKDFLGAKELKKEMSKKKDEEDKKKGVEMRQAAMEGQTSMCIALFFPLYNYYIKIALCTVVILKGKKDSNTTDSLSPTVDVDCDDSIDEVQKEESELYMCSTKKRKTSMGIYICVYAFVFIYLPICVKCIHCQLDIIVMHIQLFPFILKVRISSAVAGCQLWKCLKRSMKLKQG